MTSSDDAAAAAAAAAADAADAAAAADAATACVKSFFNPLVSIKTFIFSKIIRRKTSR